MACEYPIKYSLMKQHYNTTGSWLNKKIAIFRKGLLFIQDFAWQRSTFYLLCSVWALLKREPRHDEGCKKNPSDSANHLTRDWLWITDGSLRNFKASKMLGTKSIGGFIGEWLWNHEAKYLHLDGVYSAVNPSWTSPIHKCDPYLEHQIHCKRIRTITSAVYFALTLLVFSVLCGDYFVACAFYSLNRTICWVFYFFIVLINTYTSTLLCRQEKKCN